MAAWWRAPVARRPLNDLSYQQRCSELFLWYMRVPFDKILASVSPENDRKSGFRRRHGPSFGGARALVRTTLPPYNLYIRLRQFFELSAQVLHIHASSGRTFFVTRLSLLFCCLRKSSTSLRTKKYVFSSSPS